jgi:hypothetical protein
MKHRCCCFCQCNIAISLADDKVVFLLTSTQNDDTPIVVSWFPGIIVMIGCSSNTSLSSGLVAFLSTTLVAELLSTMVFLSIIRRRDDGQDETEGRGFNVVSSTFILFILGSIMINL